MKNFSKVLENLNRDKMPQFDNDHLDDLKKELDEKGIVYTEEKIEASKLSPTQENINSQKVKKIKNELKETKRISRLIVSKDYSVLDGHHRWKAGLSISESLKLPILRIHLPKNKALINLDDINEKIKGNVDDINVVGVYPGRFQPFHKGHERTFNILRDHFGKSDTYISTSNKSGSKKSPFNFEEKKTFINQIFNIPKKFIFQEKNLYIPKNILKKYDEEKTALVVGIGEKDVERLNSYDYYEEYSPEKLSKYDNVGFEERGFYLVVDHKNDIKLNNEPVSGTNIRKIFRSDLNLDKKKKVFRHVFGKYDKKMIKFLLNRLKKKNEKKLFDHEELKLLSDNINLKKIMKEIARTDAAIPADDGPASWHSSDKEYQTSEDNLAKGIGYEVLDYMLGSEVYDKEELKQDALKFVSFFPTGVMNKHTKNPLESYYNFSEAVATGAGYEVLDYIGLEQEDKEEETEVVPDVGLSDKEESPSDEESQTTTNMETGGISQLDESLRKSRKSLLYEGGSFGHLNHPYEDRSLTFKDFKNIIKSGFEGSLKNPLEKTDGQNLKITWKDSELRASRNKGHIKNSGEKSLNIKRIKKKYEGRGDIQKAFVYAMKDLSKAFSDISNNKLKELFKDGRRFMSVEVIYPPTQNVIPYNRSLIVFHSLKEYDSEANIKDEYPQYADRIYNIIKDKGEVSQEKYNIKNQPNIGLKDISKEKSEKLKSLLSSVEKLRKRFDLEEKDEIAIYHEEWWKNFIKSKADKFNYNLPSDVFSGLLKRWVYQSKSGDNGYSLRTIKKDINHDKFLKFVKKFDKKKHKKVLKKVNKPFEIICLISGIEILKSSDYSLVEDKKEAKNEMIKNFKECIKNIKNNGDDKNIKKMKRELKRLKKIGGIESILPCEGIVFEYKGNMYKFTGSFAPVNQIMGILRYNN